MEDEERSQYLHYIHNWYQNEGTDDVLVPITAMERFIMKQFSEHLNFLLDPEDPDTRPFYHDFFEDQNAMKIATVRSFHSRTRLSVRRVLGCGHFILGLVYLEYNVLERRFGDQWPMLDLWQEMKEDLNAKNLMNNEVPCDHVSVYEWLRTFYTKVFERMPLKGEIVDYARIPFTLLNVVGPCEKNQDDTSDEFMQNYQEFLVFHLHNIHEMGLFPKGPELQQYYRLVRKQDTPWPVTFPISQKYKFHRKVLRRRVEIRAHMQYQYQQIQHHIVTKENIQPETLRNIGLAAMAVAKWRSHVRAKQEDTDDENCVIVAPSTNLYHWHRVPDWAYQVRRWHRVTYGTSVKLIGMDWKLGCGGCPRTMQMLKSSKSGRTRYCKWVTIRRVILVRRVIWRRWRVPIRRRVGQAA